ncbi:BspA family leucine-rich repeat surface protein [Aestuariivivens sediminicola]|uniref:BspA family leucine-rich repeat surface protein n=1 Tax=Aestuariivivens sediminicola TaxID=2913560 RepID=UPI001F55B45D|nr:BspA family leucine-rich repeat surface protein [Aestuariivivens sediminicola]
MKTNLPAKILRKKGAITLLLFTLCLSLFSQSETYFITTWKTDNSGSSNPTSISIHTNGEGYNYDVDWTYDGITFNAEDSGVVGDITHDYTVAGTYTVAIRGTFPRIYFNCSGDKNKILSIEQWGTNAWSSMEGAFCGCLNLVSNATDTPDLSGVTNMSNAFWTTLAFNADISDWNVSSVTDMSYAFGVSAITGDLSGWNVSNVTNMYAMFSTTNVNSNLSTWNVGNVINMAYMFEGSNFNGDIGNWNVSSVTDMSSMFENNTSFNGNISGWTIVNVLDMSSMFRGATAFNQDISNWDVSSVENLGGMFAEANAFTADITGWDVGSATSLGGMFSGNTTFNQDISGWDISSVESLSGMFAGATAFNQDIGVWDVSNVKFMSTMFSGATSFDRDLGNWDISSIISMEDMFLDAALSTANFDNTIIGWNTLSVGEIKIPMNVTFHAGNSTYCTSEAAILSLINDYNWSFFGTGVQDCSGLGLNDLNQNLSLNIYPNPAEQILHISSDIPLNRITINELNGKILLDITVTDGKMEFEIPITALRSGFYFVNTRSDQGHAVKKFIKL